MKKEKNYKKNIRSYKKDIRIKPSIDKSLKEVFDKIGTPPKQPFKPDPFQIEALEAIEKYDCLVTVPTGSGKTWIAKETIRKNLKVNKRTWYASPLKALTNNIYAGFVEDFGKENVGILTGDRKENPDAPIIVGTTEILRNQLYDAMYSGENIKVDFVVLDEAHYLGDEDRGVVWEEVLIYLNSRISILMLSATVGNADQIAAWLFSIRKKKCVVIEESKRIVPLFPLFFSPTGFIAPLIDKKKPDKLSKNAFYYTKNKERTFKEQGLPNFGDILLALKKFNLLPAIFFLKSRADCDAAINLCSTKILDGEPDKKEKLKEKVAELIEKYPYLSDHKQRYILENMAVASHHSGQLPIWKIIVETLMNEGVIDAIFATSTVAAGVNFPARTVFLINSDRFNGHDFVPLDATQLQQMTGRAGRRGMDNIGFAAFMPEKFMDLRLVAKLVKASPTNILSQIKINFSMVLNLLLSHNVTQIKNILESSFASFLISTLKKKKRKTFNENPSYIWQDFMHHFEFLKKEGFVGKDNILTKDGMWASNLRIDAPLLVAEGLRKNCFPTSDPALLAALMTTFVNERDYSDEKFDSDKINDELYYTIEVTKKKLEPLMKKMKQAGFSANNLYISPAYTIYKWVKGEEWDELVKDSGLADGDLTRLIMRVSDNLRHIKALRESFPEIAKTASISIETLMREPVVSYYD